MFETKEQVWISDCFKSHVARFFVWPALFLVQQVTIVALVNTNKNKITVDWFPSIEEDFEI